MYVPTKRNIIKFKRENPDLYKQILDEYEPVFDKWVAVDMYINDIPPPTCELCGVRLQVSKKLPSRCKKCLNIKRLYYYDDISNYFGLEVKKWKGGIPSVDNITITCAKHGEYEQQLSSFLNGHGCQKCYFENKKGKVKYNTEEWVSLAKKIHGDIYGYEKTVYTGAENHLIITCKEHGDFYQQANVHTRGHGCPSCANEYGGDKARYSTEEYLSMAREIHGDKYNYDRTVYMGMSRFIEYECPMHGVYRQRAGDHIHNRHGCIDCGQALASSKSRSSGEIAISDIVSSMGVDVINNYRQDGFEIDIFCPDFNVGIEFNGLYWHSEIGGKRGKYYHYNKWKYYNDNGISLYQIFEDEFDNKFDIVISKLNYIFGKVKSTVGARKCQIRQLRYSDEASFLNKYHIQGELRGREKSLGAYYGGGLIGVINCKSRDNYMEITRFATDCAHTYPGLFSKMLKSLLKDYHGLVVSFSNNDHSNGNLYKAAGFNCAEILPPVYWYTNNYLIKENRKAYTKADIQRKFGIDIQNKTEWELMQSLGYDRIWDSGKIRWEMPWQLKEQK